MGVVVPFLSRESDPTIEQTRALTLQLFAAELSEREIVEPSPSEALQRWKERAARRGDRGLVVILERFDLETFMAEWRSLARALESRGRVAMLHWLSDREMR